MGKLFDALEDSDPEPPTKKTNHNKRKSDKRKQQVSERERGRKEIRREPRQKESRYVA